MKIFVTVGTQLPFDRLLRAIDEWLADKADVTVDAQVGPSNYRPIHVRAQPFVSPERFAELARGADLLVAHAGTGSIFTALEIVKPIIVMPRRAALGEHRNDHQLATVERLRGIPGVNVAEDEAELVAYLDNPASLTLPQAEFPAEAQAELLVEVSDFINDRPPTPPRGGLLRALLGGLRHWRGNGDRK